MAWQYSFYLVDAVRAALAEVGEGSREISIAVRGKDELTMLAGDVEAMVAKVHAEERARRELVESISHDLRTPVTTIRLIAEGLEEGIFEQDRLRDQLQLISTHVRGLGALIDDLLELSRQEAGEVNWSMRQVRLDQRLILKCALTRTRVSPQARGRLEGGWYGWCSGT
jgi:signal transduction histidine kinase